MEPRLVSRGNIHVWVRQGVTRAPASMEPRLVSRGNRVRAATVAATSSASMEPRLVSRGNQDLPDFKSASILLQWSRGS